MGSLDELSSGKKQERVLLPNSTLSRDISVMMLEDAVTEEDEHGKYLGGRDIG